MSDPKLSDDQKKNIINIINNFPAQMIPGGLKEMTAYVNEANAIIKILQDSTKQEEQKKE